MSKQTTIILLVSLAVMAAAVSFTTGYIAGREHIKYQLNLAFEEGGKSLKRGLNKTFWESFANTPFTKEQAAIEIPKSNNK